MKGNHAGHACSLYIEMALSQGRWPWCPGQRQHSPGLTIIYVPCRRYGWWCVTDVRYQVRMYYNWKEVQLFNNVVSDTTTESHQCLVNVGKRRLFISLNGTGVQLRARDGVETISLIDSNLALHLQDMVQKQCVSSSDGMRVSDSQQQTSFNPPFESRHGGRCTQRINHYRNILLQSPNLPGTDILWQSVSMSRDSLILWVHFFCSKFIASGRSFPHPCRHSKPPPHTTTSFSCQGLRRLSMLLQTSLYLVS